MDHDSYYFNSTYQDEDEDLQDVLNVKEIESDPLLISLVRDHPYLYNKELTDFKDSIKKQNAWIEIASCMDMTADECQSRWTRLRERYSREKKQRQEETTTGSGASKRKIFEFFENMQFLERFVKRRRTMTNIYKEKVSPVARSYNIKKNFGFYNEKENNSSLANVATMIHNRSVSPVARSYNVQKNFSSHNEKENNSSLANVATMIHNRSVSPVARSSNVQKNYDEKEDNLFSINMGTLIEQPSAKSNVASGSQHTPTHMGDSLTSDLHINASDISSESASSIPRHTRDKSLIRQRIQSKGKPQTYILENAIGKVTSLLENRCVSSSQTSLKPEVGEDMAFCQLIFSLLINLSENTKAEKKKAILRTLYDI